MGVLNVFSARGAVGGGQQGFIGDRSDREDGSGYIYNNQPSTIVVEDPKAAQERRKSEKRAQQAKRTKAINSHSNPLGSFFNESQRPKAKDLASK